MNDKTEQTVTDELPCPFCGSTEGFYVEEGSTFRWRFISCRNCSEGTEVRHKNYSDDPASYIADWNAAAPYPAMLRKEIDTLRAQLAEAQRNAATPTPDAFHKALRLAQRESLDRTGSGVVNWNQADAVMSDGARHLVECYIAAIDAARGEKNGA